MSDAGKGNSGWIISYQDYDPEEEGRREAIFALGNGAFVTRASTMEARADSVHYPGTYRAACYDNLLTAPVGKREERKPELESLAKLPDWLCLKFRCDGGPWFSLDEANLEDYHHSLNMETGITERRFRFTDEQGRSSCVGEKRLVSMAEPQLGALQLDITAENWSGDLEICSGIDGDVSNSNVDRYADYEHQHIRVSDCGLLFEENRADDRQQALVMTSRTRRSGILIVQSVRHRLSESPEACELTRGESQVQLLYRLSIRQGRTVGLEKVTALCTSLESENPLRDVRGATMKANNFPILEQAHGQAWEALWEQADLAAENPWLARGLRFHIFHLLQTVSPHSAALDTGVPARGWHGEAYRGHIFWDDLFIFPFLNFRFPALAKSLLLYRYRRLDQAKRAARDCGLRGAMFPWRSGSSGQEVTPRYQENLLSGHWMSDPTRMQCHINGAIVYNIWHYYLVTGDEQFMHDYGAEVVLEIARLWASLATYSADRDRFEIKGVIGPDEYHNRYPDQKEPGLDNNAYTNLLAVWCLCRASELLERLGPAGKALMERLQIGADELGHWDEISRKMRIAFHGDCIISQFEGYEKLKPFRDDLLPKDLRKHRADWALEAIGESADHYQVTKQADTLTLFYLFSPAEICALLQRLGYAFDTHCLLNTANYYLSRTTHRSSLSRVVYAGALAPLDMERSWDFYRHALDTDLQSLPGERVAEGIHLGAMGGTLDILQRRYLGIDASADGALQVEPLVPPELGELKFNFRFRGQALHAHASNGELCLLNRAENSGNVTVISRGQRRVLQPGDRLTVGF